MEELLKLANFIVEKQGLAGLAVLILLWKFIVEPFWLKLKNTKSAPKNGNMNPGSHEGRIGKLESVTNGIPMRCHEHERDLGKMDNKLEDLSEDMKQVLTGQARIEGALGVKKIGE